VVCCLGSHTTVSTDHLFSTTRIPSSPTLLVMQGCKADASSVAITDRQEALVAQSTVSVTNLTLTYSQVCASTNTNCSCPEVLLGDIRLVCSERGSPH